MIWWRAQSLFFDISKVFDKVWHTPFLFKLRESSISNNLLDVLTDFLCKKKQALFSIGKILLGKQWRALFFLIDINDSSKAH